jgi:tryptophan synthase alpha chain
MNTRYDSMFARLRAQNEGAFGVFLMLGDPDMETSLQALQAMADAGADFLEVGIPFSDPIADGPTIQAAAMRALKAGATQEKCFDVLTRFRKTHPDTPVGVLTYSNLALAHGLETFCARCAQAGVDSLLLADVPSIEAEPFADAASKAGVAPVLIAAGNTPEATINRIARLSRGYVYCVAREGVTGAETAMRTDHHALMERLDRAGAAPAVLGFGISRPEHVRSALESGAAGAITGSAIVSSLAADGIQAAAKLTAELKKATRA